MWSSVLLYKLKQGILHFFINSCGAGMAAASPRRTGSQRGRRPPRWWPAIGTLKGFLSSLRKTFISGGQLGGKSMTKRSPSVKNSLPTLDEVFEILPTSCSLRLLITKSACPECQDCEAILWWWRHLVAPAGGQSAGNLDDELGVALVVAHLKLTAQVEGRRVAEHLFQLLS